MMEMELQVGHLYRLRDGHSRLMSLYVGKEPWTFENPPPVRLFCAHYINPGEIFLVTKIEHSDSAFRFQVLASSTIGWCSFEKRYTLEEVLKEVTAP